MTIGEWECERCGARHPYSVRSMNAAVDSNGHVIGDSDSWWEATICAACASTLKAWWESGRA